MARSTLFLHRLSVLDFAFLAPGLGFQGESFHVSAELEGELDAQGFILDFGPAKKLIKSLVDSSVDHKLVVPTHPLLSGTAKGFRFESLEYHAPQEAVVLLEEEQVSLASLEKFLEETIQPELPSNVKRVKIRLEQESRFFQEPNYRYTHGLRLHEGNCQRLLHGHRNPIEVWLGTERQSKLEELLALEWAGAHFTYAPTLLNQNQVDLPLGRRIENHPGLAELGYTSPQGEFWAKFPASRVILLEQEPSIENIAKLGWERLVQEGVSKDVRVVAYEGINKGSCYQIS